MKSKTLLTIIALLFCCASWSVCAKPDDQLKQVEQELSDKKHQQEELDAAAHEANKNLEDLRQRMIHSTKSLQDKLTEQEILENKLDDLTDQIAEKSKNAAHDRQQLSLMISALIEIASRPLESLFLQDHNTADHIHRRLLLQAILPRLKQQSESAARDLVALYDLKGQLAQQKKLVAAATENLKKQQSDLDQMIATRQGFLKRTEAEKEETARHLAALSEQARDLHQLMEQIAPKTPLKPTAKSNIALRWPVAGTLRKHFGDKDADGVVSEGLTFAAPSGAPVVAPAAGRIVFAGPFRGYGLIMILQHDNSYHSFLSGFGRIDTEMNQDVAAGEPLGVLPTKSGAKPELYFEWRRGDEPVNPQGH